MAGKTKKDLLDEIEMYKKQNESLRGCLNKDSENYKAALGKITAIAHKNIDDGIKEGRKRASDSAV